MEKRDIINAKLISTKIEHFLHTELFNNGWSYILNFVSWEVDLVKGGINATGRIAETGEIEKQQFFSFEEILNSINNNNNEKAKREKVD